ncbi:hypothetical protein [Azonexus sp.]|uniref:hypothetical protein n=1 Tax=Azonexus sp. TaxID=1872668 RepID=UPI0035ADA6A4
MEWQQVLDTFSRMPAGQRQLWWLAAAGLLFLMLGLLWLESRLFKRSGRVAGWLFVRLVSALAAPLLLAVLIVPARMVGGPEALAVFYAALLFVAPPLWFGSHLLAGRWARPALTGGESLALAVSGLLILAIPGTAFLAAEAPLYAAAREIGKQRTLPADNTPLRHAVQPVQRYHLPGVGLIYTQSLLAPPDTRLLAVEQRQGGLWPGEQGSAHPVYCINGNDLHLMWSAKEEAPYLRLHWEKGFGGRQRSEFTPALDFANAPPAAEFTVAFRSDGVDPVAPIPRPRAYLILEQPGLTPYTQMLGAPPEAGEKRSSDCVLSGFTRWTAGGGDWQLRAIGFSFQLPSGELLRSLIERHATG